VLTDREVIDDSDGPDGLSTPAHPSSPPMTGSLILIQREGSIPLGRRLLSLPGGIHFQKLTLTLRCWEDHSLAAALVAECSHTIKYLYISCELLGTSVRYCVRADH